MSGRIERQAGSLIGERYRLDRLIGRGGMGVVWSATHTVTRRRVALKMLSTRLAGHESMRRRLFQEARAAATVDHPNVVAVSDVFEIEDHVPVIVQDLLEGETLATRLLRDAPLPAEETCRILLPVLDAVAAAHAHGIVHRDLKPDNVFLTLQAGVVTPMVLDFGIAKLLAIEESEDLVTATGVMLGTVGYMAPEQGFGEIDVDLRADIWSLGVVLYECLSGVRPVEAANLGQYLKKLVHDAITPLSVMAPEVPAGLCAIVAQMLTVDREARVADLGVVRAALEGVLTSASLPPSAQGAGPPDPAAGDVASSRRRWRVALPVAAVVIVSAGAFALSRALEPAPPDRAAALPAIRSGGPPEAEPQSGPGPSPHAAPTVTSSAASAEAPVSTAARRPPVVSPPPTAAPAASLPPVAEGTPSSWPGGLVTEPRF